jgi:hypothetical protein
VPGKNFDMGATVGLISVDVCKGQFIRAMENASNCKQSVFTLHFVNGNLVELKHVNCL